MQTECGRTEHSRKAVRTGEQHRRVAEQGGYGTGLAGRAMEISGFYLDGSGRYDRVLRILLQSTICLGPLPPWLPGTHRRESKF